MTKVFSLSALAGGWLALGVAGSAQAQTATRAWVSGHGMDAAGCGATSNPCRSLQYAHDNIIVPGGEIDILDPAGYGGIMISKAVSIVADGVGTAGVQAANYNNAITISAGPNDAVHLRGLTIEGLGSGGAGIYFTSGAKLEVIGCTIRNFVGTGILTQSSIGSNPVSVLISNDFILDNGNTGIGFFVSSQTIASINNVTVSGSYTGINMVANGPLEVQISHSHIDNNTNTGIQTIGSSASIAANVVLIDSTLNQTPTALALNGYSNVWLSHIVQSAVPGFSNLGIALSGSGNAVASDGTNHLNSGSLSTWGFR